ncbi:3-oxoacyl-[acyl-carrier-protein] reductase [Flavobacteriaceae bacterium UJ101]|nr:3-oxoacyl-[acyl-carrier-protein] reductase [Flavobacteriaceae bacterium UJ101]
MFDLKDKNVLITGGYGYLGKAMTLGLLKQNATVIVLGRSKERFDDVFKNELDKPDFEKFDISSSSTTIKNIFLDIEKKYGKIDVLINNAFYAIAGGEMDDFDDDAFRIGIEGTLDSVHKCIKSIIPIFRKQGKGKIINIASMYGMVSPDFKVYKDNEMFLNPPQYGAAKAGVIQLTKYFASLLGRENICVNAISPGPFPSIEVQKSETFITNLSAKTLLGRIGSPEELQGVCVFLSSDSSNYVTGQNIAVDGGWTTT